MIFVCVKCNKVFEEPPEGRYLSNHRSICDDCAAVAVNEYVDERARILRAPIGRALQEEILREAA